ncbi:Pectin lyase fold/virulence factor [Penicillium tannophilum]|nr:Pectin lyase fold/virulence factor [Penicillium tannophilum]
MRGSLSFTALAAIVATASSAIIPIAAESGRAIAHAVPEAPAKPASHAFHILPPWLESLIESATRPTSAAVDSPDVTPSSALSSSTTTTPSPVPTPKTTAAPVAPAPTSTSNKPPAPKPSSSSSTSTLQSTSSTTSKPSATSFTPATKTCPAGSRKAADIYWLDAQDHNQAAAGYAPYAGGSNVYPVYRNVMDYGAVNDGSGDQTAKLQKAIDDDGNGGTRKGKGTTRYPAEVYLPGGTYTLGSTLTLTVGTIIVGDPQNPPIIKAASDFQGQFLVMGYDKNNGNPETSFMMLIKNVILDTTNVTPNTKITALQWGVAQGSGLTNVQVHMPTNSKGHTGIDIAAGSTIAVTDVRIVGGATGIINSNQQVNFKNLQFVGCGTAFFAKGGWTVLLQGALFESCGTGINMTTNGLGSLVLLDSTVKNSGPVVRFHDSSHDTGNQNSQLLIQNLVHDGTNPIAVDSDGKTRLAATSHIDTWLWGTLVEGEYEQGATHKTQRSANLLVNDKFFTKAQPTYTEYGTADVVNVKSVSGFTVKGDGLTDDTASLNAILKQNAENCKITYFPFGVYRVSDTIFVPVGTRIVGEAWAVISGYGDAFKDASNPKAVVKLGNPGDVGLIEIQDMRFSVGEILPGAKVLEINAAGQQPGDVGLWNTNVMIGGTAETSISNVCTSQDPKDCMAAFMVMHLTESSSAYIENFWGWTADHNLDSTSLLTIVSTGRGILVEATKGTWLTGTGSEHHWLYDYNFNNAANVFAGLLQSESPYMQGSGEYENAPAPWTANPKFGDPDFSWCAAKDQKCRTSIATNIEGGSNIALYNSAAWAFFDGYWNGLYNEPCSGKCQTNMMRVAGAPQNLVWYSIGTRQTDVMILDGKTNPREASYPGGWEGIIQAYAEFSN